MANQNEIAAHLDLSARRVRDIFQELKVDHRKLSLDEIRIVYIRHIRSKAAGHISDKGGDLRHENFLNAQLDRQIKAAKLGETIGVLVFRQQISEAMSQAVLSLKIELSNMKDMIGNAINNTYGIEVDRKLLDDLCDDVPRKLSGFTAKFDGFDK